ncbi:PREDICTED: poly(U)-specific endoribonuclease [Gekko japonicus]|uniref:Uridylate-specific endoribonuclease n=1 Tax=Gekko japonicus TaxID=146911 RepID=A0ABM1KA58_GEKJA|nr:PREDICTED: poly(U)-specific endoribonuclease [Gekko japonicus]
MSALYTAPDSCKGRCNEKYNREDVCHCNTKCEKYQNCCDDFHVHCGQDSKEKEPASEGSCRLSKEYVLLANSPGESVSGFASFYRLFSSVNEEKLFSKPTYASFIKLLDNYQKKVGKEEDFTAEQLKEQDHFLEETMKTKVMKELYRFLHDKNRYSTEEAFVADLKEMWFGLYSRKREDDSSGFEHVFLGEIKNGKVSGFHNWISFYLQEKQGHLNYFSHNYDGPWTSYPDVLGLQFSWDGSYKEVGSAFIGSSPEFEFGLYSLCFITRPGKVCHLKLGSHDLDIQTYTWDKSTYGNGKKYIATAYVKTS